MRDQRFGEEWAGRLTRRQNAFVRVEHEQMREWLTRDLAHAHHAHRSDATRAGGRRPGLERALELVAKDLARGRRPTEAQRCERGAVRVEGVAEHAPAVCVPR